MPSEMLEYQTTWTIRSRKERPDGKEKLDVFDWPNLPPLGNDEPLGGGKKAELSLF
jgi:hypothetical protein